MGAQLADEAYRDLIKQLTAAGFEVIDAKAAAPAMAPVARHPAVVPVSTGYAGWTVFSPKDAPPVKGYALETGMGTLAGPGSLIAMGKVSQALDAVILLPRVLIGYIRMDSSGQSNYTANASVDAKLRFRIDPSSRTDFIAANERGGSMPGGWSCPGSGTDDLFGILYLADDRSDSVSLHNAFAQAGMGSLYRQSLVYDVEVAPLRYAALTRAAFQGYNAALVAEIKAAKGL
jgi:hypothetical protein